MKFASPQWLWLLALIPLIYGAYVWNLRARRRRFEQFAKPEVWSVIAPELDWNARLRKAGAWAAALACVAVALARPQWGTREEVSNVAGLDIMIALDVSNSMEVEDVVPSRIKKARHLVRRLLNQVEGDRVGLVAFAGSAFVASPLTSDLGYVAEIVDIVGPKSVSNQGTDIGIGLETAMRAMERAAEEVGAPEQAPTSSRVIVLISDGENHEQAAVEAAKKIRASGTLLYVFGVGTEKGGPVPLRDDAGQLMGYKRDRGGSDPVVSRFDPSFLMSLASGVGGKYWTITPGEGELEEFLQQVRGLTRGEYAERRYTIYLERYQFPLFLAVLILLLELSLPARRILRGQAASRDKVLPGVSALGWLAVFTALVGAPAHADELRSYLANKKGLEAFEKGNFEEARKNFGTAQALDPESPELQFNQSVIQYGQEDTERALQGFEDAASLAIQRNRHDIAARSLFNQGVALSKKGDVDGAMKSYLRALDAAKTGGSKTEDLDRDIRKNIELLAKKREEQKQKQNQQGKDPSQQGSSQNGEQNQQQGEGGDKQSEGNGKGQSQGKGQGEDQGSKDGEGNGKEQKKDQGGGGEERDKREGPVTRGNAAKRTREFRSEKLSKEAAERVMAELSSREQHLQGRLKKQGTQSQSQGKDW